MDPQSLSEELNAIIERLGRVWNESLDKKPHPLSYVIEELLGILEATPDVVNDLALLEFSTNSTSVTKEFFDKILEKIPIVK